MKPAAAPFAYLPPPRTILRDGERLGVVELDGGACVTSGAVGARVGALFTTRDHAGRASLVETLA
jgi:hypothetical protein